MKSGQDTRPVVEDSRTLFRCHVFLCLSRQPSVRGCDYTVLGPYTYLMVVLDDGSYFLYETVSQDITEVYVVHYHPSCVRNLSGWGPKFRTDSV